MLLMMIDAASAEYRVSIEVDPRLARDAAATAGLTRTMKASRS